MRALQRRPEDRWNNAAEFRDALDEWIRRTTRVSTRNLANLLGQVINAPTADLEGVVAKPTDEANALSGPLTRIHQARAEAEAARARAEFIAGEAIPSGVTGDPASSGVMQVARDGDDDVATEDVDIPSGPRETGEIAQHPILRVVHRLAKAKGTGMLALEGRAGVFKEAYFVEGQPQFVSSNVEESGSATT